MYRYLIEDGDILSQRESKKKEKWMVFSAWPYVNATPHLGNMIGSILSSDVAARFLRMTGAEVVFASGSDMHGTPIEVEALKQKISPKELAERNHKRIKELFERWRISFDNYTNTESKVHISFVQDFYKKVYENGYVFEDEIEMLYCPNDKIFLPDRFVVGTCPYCLYEKAHGDQCENCGRLLDPTMLINPRCTICGATPILRKTRHWFIDLRKLEDKIRKYIEENKNLPPNARNMSLQMIKDGLKPRSLTRDNKWGIPAPFPGANEKTIYVWMEAVLGYVSAVKEYFENNGQSDKWKEFWFDQTTKSVYFIGKDNIPFHTIIFPSLLIANGEGYVLPWTVASTEYLLFKGLKFSKSKRIGIWIDEALEVFPVDYWRYVLIALRPEVRDTNFTWEDFMRVINSELNDNIGNYIHRVLTLTYRKFNGKVPKPRELDEKEKQLEEKIYETVRKTKESMYRFRFKDALSKILHLSSFGNSFINDTRPWEQEDDKAASILFVALHVVKALAIMLFPIIPDSSQKIWEMLGYDDELEKRLWDEAIKPVQEGQALKKPKPLFKKISKEQLDEAIQKIEKLRGYS
ncbi:MAG: methionine--tRNA ligase [Thermoproteales archaeon]|nr:methionine--tRNA ligase [Thermoproteales archaeon]